MKRINTGKAVMGTTKITAAILRTAGAALAILTAGVLAPAFAQDLDADVRKPTVVSVNANGDSNKIPLSDPVNMIPTDKKPDVHIVVGSSKGKFVVSAVYSMRVPRSVADAHLKRLIDRTGWNVSDISFEDGQVTSMTTDKASGLSDVMSSISFTTDAPLIDKENVVTLEPFLVAFRDRNRINLTFLGQKGVTPTGPRGYNDDNIRLQAPYAPGALTYMAEIKNHNFESLNLPRTDSPDVVSGDTRIASRTNWTMIFIMTGLGILAVGVGAITFALTRRTA